jgi:addiction module HigA family antidote
MEQLANVHPGEVLREEFLVPLNITMYALAQRIGVDQGRISEIIRGRRSITPETALLLARVFDTSPQFWLNLQNAYDLQEQRARLDEKLRNIRPYEKICA